MKSYHITAIAFIFCFPSETALQMATLSAQILKPYDAFSTFAPTIIRVYK